MSAKLGIIAGGGNLPKKVVQVCRQTNRDHFIIAYEGMTEPELVEQSPHTWQSLGQISATMDCLHKEGIKEVVFVGRIERPSFSALKMDKRAAALLAKAALRGFGDNAVLTLIIEELEKEGFKVIAAQDLLNDILAPEGIMGVHQPDSQDLKDIERGKAVLSQLSSADIGQSVVIQEEMVLGMEAIEGTDALIDRCATVKRAGGKAPILVKMRKIGQDMRADLPTIGLQTIEKVQAAGFKGIAVEAKSTIMLNRQEVIDFANKENLFVIGIRTDS